MATLELVGLSLAPVASGRLAPAPRPSLPAPLRRMKRGHTVGLVLVVAITIIRIITIIIISISSSSSSSSSLKTHLWGWMA